MSNMSSRTELQTKARSVARDVGFDPTFVNRIVGEIVDVMARFPNLNVITKCILNNFDGQPDNALSLSGTIPCTFRGATYNIPVEFMLPSFYPTLMPQCFVRPTPGMMVDQKHPLTQPDGECRWPDSMMYDPTNANFMGFVDFWKRAFEDHPPVRAIKTAPSKPPAINSIQRSQIPTTQPTPKPQSQPQSQIQSRPQPQPAPMYSRAQQAPPAPSKPAPTYDRPPPSPPPSYEEDSKQLLMATVVSKADIELDKLQRSKRELEETIVIYDARREELVDTLATKEEQEQACGEQLQSLAFEKSKMESILEMGVDAQVLPDNSVQLQYAKTSANIRAFDKVEKELQSALESGLITIDVWRKLYQDFTSRHFISINSARRLRKEWQQRDKS